MFEEREVIFLIFLNFLMYCSSREIGNLPCPRTLARPLVNYTKLSNGSLIDHHQTYSPDLYWTDDEKNTTYGCACSSTKTCVRKCCEFGKVLQGRACTDAKTVEGSLTVLRPWNEELDPDLWWITKLEDAFQIVESMVCPEGMNSIILNPEYPEDMFVLLRNGTLQVDSNTFYSPAEYCLDWTDYTRNISAAVCMWIPTNITDSAYPIGMLVSVIFLLITFLVYAILPELHNLHGKTLMCHMASLVVAYSGLVVHKFEFGYLITKHVCISLAFIMYFAFLASFFWLNVMCFDIWWTFGGFRSLRGSLKQREHKKFIVYSVYAWGCATILTGVCLIMDLVPHLPDYLIKPEFSEEKCWFRWEIAKGIYFYCPMGITVVCNIFLFISTASKILKHKKDTAHHLRNSESSRHKDNKQWFKLYLKLFIVMGVNWSMEIISWLMQDEPKWIFYITDIANTLQGLAIFIIFVWKDKVKRLLLKHYGCKSFGFKNYQGRYQSSARTCTSLMPLQEMCTNKLEDKHVKTISESEYM